MGLGLYRAPRTTAAFTSDSSFTVTVDGRLNTSTSVPIYIRNDDSNLWYRDIRLSLVDGAGISRVDGSKEGFSFKLIQKDTPPHLVEWDRIEAGNELTVSTELGSGTKSDITTYITVWVRIEVPRGQSIGLIDDIYFNLEATEQVV